MIDRDDPRLTAFLLDELDDDSAADVQAAIEASHDLQEHVEGLRGTIGVLQGALQDAVAKASMTDEQIQEIDSQAASAKVTTDSPAPSVHAEAHRIYWGRLAIAALVLYAAGMSYYAFRKPTLSDEQLAKLTMAANARDAEQSSHETDSIEQRSVEGLDPLRQVETQSNDPAVQDPSGSVPQQGQSGEETETERRSVTIGFDGLSGMPTEDLDIKFDNNSFGGGSTQGRPNIQFVPELGQVIVHGTSDEIDRVRAVISQIKRSNDGPAETPMPQPSNMAGSDPFGDGKPGSDPFGGGVDDFSIDSSSDPFGGEMSMDMGGMDGMGMGGMMGGGGGMEVEEPMAMGMVDLSEMGVDGQPARVARPVSGLSDGQVVTETPRIIIGEEEVLEVGGDMMDRVDQSREIAGGRLQAEVRSQMRWGQRQLRSDPIGVGTKLGSLLSNIESTQGIEAKLRDELASQVRSAVQVAARREAEFTEEKLNLEQQQEAATAGLAANREDATEEQRTRLLALNKARDEARQDVVKLYKKYTEAQKRAKQRKVAAAKTWKPASAAFNRARLSVGHHDDLALAARDTYVRIDGFRARVFFDLYYYNDRPQQLEGQFLLRLPTDASLHYFAFGTTNLKPRSTPPATGKPGDDTAVKLTAAQAAVASLRDATETTGTDLGRRAVDPNFVAPANSTFESIKAARVVPKQKAALAYEETVRRRVDPALVEWSGPGIFQTKVFPLMPHKLHRIVVGYDVNLLDDDKDRVFKLDLPEGETGGRVEFDIAAASGTQVAITPETDPFISGKRAYYRYENVKPQDYTVRLIGAENTLLQSGKTAMGDAFFATRATADLPDEPAKLDTDRAVFLLDTSWSDRPAAFSRRLKLMDAILRQNRDSIKQFAVLMFNVEQRWWQPQFVTNNKDNTKAFFKDANSIALEGATDLENALSVATTTAWINSDSKVHPNYFLLSDGVPTWGSTDLASLADPLQAVDRSAGGGALFAYHLAGHTSDKATLQWLVDAGAGAVFDVAVEADLGKVARAHQSRPWQITDVTAKGADEILIQGSAANVYPGQTLTIAGQGHLKGPVKIQFQRGGEKQTLIVAPDVTIASPAAARLYGQFAVEQLEPYADELEEVTIAFARYFRVPGRTCSMVMLETAADYQRFGVNVSPEEDRLVVASTSVKTSIDEMEADLLEARQQPLKQFTAWVQSLESASLVKVPTALRLAMKRLPDETFGFKTQPLKCRSWKSKQIDDTYADELELEIPGFAVVMDEANRRLDAFGVDDAIKTASTMVEAKPSDPNTLRSVAFRAIEWKRSDQAAPLLWRLARARPYQPQCLLLLGRAMSQSGDVDGAMVCFDLVCNGNWNNRWASGAKDIAKVELLHVLEQVDSGQAKSAIRAYARARLGQLRGQISDEGLDVAVVMHWNTDRTDVDLHVTEPSGEICFYKHKQTKAGGKITQDITQGLGPEMYTLPTALQGQYKVQAKYYSADTNRTTTPSETLITVFENLGRTNGSTNTKAVTLSGKGDMQTVHEFAVKH